jgi:mono/diheme cytochrome c family protein
MQTRNEVGKRGRTGLRPGAAAAALLAIATLVVMADDTTAPKPPKPEKKTETKAKKLSGSELYQIHCSRCHPERYATEFNPAQWKTLMLHMRVRANLPAAQAKTVLKYLQEDAGS